MAILSLKVKFSSLAVFPHEGAAALRNLNSLSQSSPLSA